MRRNGISMRRLILVVAVGVGTLAFGASSASAHDVTVGCITPGSGQWGILNSEAALAMTFTAAGATPSSGTIPGGGSTMVSFSGTSLTVAATWPDGESDVVTGEGDCTVPDTTPTTEPCEFDPQLPPDDPGCQETTTTLPCEFDPQLPPDDPGCQETTTTIDDVDDDDIDDDDVDDDNDDAAMRVQSSAPAGRPRLSGNDDDGDSERPVDHSDQPGVSTRRPVHRRYVW